MARSAPSESPGSVRHTEIRRSARTHFDKWALSYDRSWLNEFVFFPSVRLCHEEIARWQLLRGGGTFTLLDVGCGTGTLLGTLAGRPDAQLLVGLDYSPEMVRLFTEKAAATDLGQRLHAVHGDAERLPFADGTFDVITCCNSFHHYPHQAEVIRGFQRVLRPGGLLVLSDGFRDNVIGWLIFDVFVATIETNVHHAAWSDVREMLLAAGFALVRQRKLNVLAPLLASVASRAE